MYEHVYPKQVRRQLAEARERAAKAEADLRDERATSAERARVANELRGRLAAVKAELAALHVGEEPYEDDRLIPTPAQWIWLWNRATPAQRLAKAEQINGLHDIVDRCTGGFHEQKIEQYDRDRQAARFRAEQAEARIAAVRALHRDDLGSCPECSGLSSVPWPCPTATALAKPAEQPAARCCVCGTSEHGGRTWYENYRGLLFCWPCAEGNRPSCPLGDACHGIDCAQRAEHGPRTDASDPLCDCHQPPARMSQHVDTGPIQQQSTAPEESATHNLEPLLGKSVTVTATVDGIACRWHGRLVALADQPTAVIQQASGANVSLPQSYAYAATADPQPTSLRALAAGWRATRGILGGVLADQLDAVLNQQP